MFLGNRPPLLIALDECLLLEIVLFPLTKFNELSSSVACVILPRPVYVVFSIIEELYPVGYPSWYPRNGIDDRVHAFVKAQGSID